MSALKLSQLPVVTTLSDGLTESCMVLQGGVNKIVALGTLFGQVTSDVTINPNSTGIDVTVNGQSTPNLFKILGTLNRVGIATNAPEKLLHVAGDVKIGGTTGGNLFVSEEEITVPSSGTLNASNSYVVTKIKTDTNSTGTQTITLSSPANNQLKIITYANAHVTKETGVSYTVTSTFINGIGGIQFTKKGDSVILYGAGSAWVVIGYNGVSFI